MTTRDNEFLKKEYEHLRAVIEARELAVRQLLATSVVASVSLLSVILAWVLQRTTLPPEVAYLFLAPVVVQIPFFFLVAANRHELQRAGSYVQVFFDEDHVGTAWDTRLSRFRELGHRESLDPIPPIYWSLFAISAALFVYALFRAGSWGVQHAWLHVLPLVVLIVPIGRAHYRFCSSRPKAHSPYVDKWREVRDQEHSGEERGVASLDKQTQDRATSG